MRREPCKTNVEETNPTIREKEHPAMHALAVGPVDSDFDDRTETKDGRNRSQKTKRPPGKR
jgi:hypothetical protein